MSINFKNIIASALVAFGSLMIAQQPQTNTAPIFSTNAKYTNGVAPGYAPTIGDGLTLNIGGGTSFCGLTVHDYAPGSLVLTDNSTNYVYLDVASSCAPNSNTSGFTSGQIPLHIVTTSAGLITSIRDVRTPFNTASGTASPNPAGADAQVQFNNNGAFGADPLYTYNNISHTLTAQNEVISGLTPGTTPLCPNGPGGALTTAGCSGGGAGNPAGSNTQVQFNNSGAFGADSLYNYNSTTHSLSLNNSLPALTPYSDIRNTAYGACVADGVTDCRAATQAAITASVGTGGGGVIFLPDNTFIANGSSLTNVSGKQFTIYMQGTIKFGSTFTIPVGAALKCLGKGEIPQFATGSATCQVLSAPGHGTLGTAITSVNTPVTITPTFVGSSIANLTVGSGITMAGVMSCTANATRDNTLNGVTYPGVGPTNTTFSIISCLDSSGNSVGFRIPPAAKIVVTGCSDTSFNNSSSFNRQAWFSTLADFPAKTLGTRMPGGSGTVSDGSCTVTGLNMDSFETESIEAVSGSTVTIRTNHTHAASDLWGEVGMAWTAGDLSYKPMEGVNVISNYGAGMWSRFNFSMDFIGDSFIGGQYLTSIPMVFSSSWGMTFAKSQTSSFSGYPCPALTYQCGDIGPPFDMMFDLLPQSIYAVNAAGGGLIGPNSTVSIGIYVTNATATTANYNGFDIFDSVIEQPMWNAITYDNRNVGSIEGTTWDYSLLQDDLVGWSQAGFTGMTDAGSYGKGSLTFLNNTNMSYGAPGFSPSTVNKYYCGKISVNGSAFFGSLIAPVCSTATVSLNDGLQLSGELTSPPMGPNYVPHASLPIIAPGSQSCTGTGCSITPGQPDPFGTSNAVLLSASAGNYATSVAATVFPLIPTAVGDVFMYGVKVRAVDGISQPIIQLNTFGADSFDVRTNVNYSSEILNGGWYTIIGFSTVTVGDATPHAMTFTETPSQGQTGASAYFSQPFIYRIQASENIPLDQIKRWRRETSHGYVPSSFTGPGYAFAPTDVLYWGADTTLKRNAAGVLEGNGSLVLDSVGTSPNTAPVCPNGAGGALTTSGCVAGSVPTNTPAWLTYLGTGADGANITANGTLCGEFYYTNFTVPVGNTVTCLFNSGGLVIHATGTCTIAGTITANTSGSGGYNGTILSGPTAGGSGGGTLAGTAGGSSFISSGGTSILAGGAGGAASGGNGSNGNPLSTAQQRTVVSNGFGIDGQYLGMAGGKQGGSSGGAGGFGGQNVVLMCNTLTGTDGTNIGTINVSGTAGGNSTGNNIGAGSGGAGGFVILSSQNTIATLPTITTTGGAGGTCGGFTGCGTGGNGGNGWSSVFQGW